MSIRNKVLAMSKFKRTISLASATIQLPLSTTTINMTTGSLSGLPLFQMALMNATLNVVPQFSIPKLPLVIHISFIKRINTQVIPITSVELFPLLTASLTL